MSLVLHSSFLHVSPRRRSFLNSRNEGFREIVRVRVCCSGLKELEKAGEKISLYGDLNTMGKLNALNREEGQERNFYVNKGYAIRVLREDFPTLFYKGAQFRYLQVREFNLDDIVFKDPLNTFDGIDNYKSIFWALRFHGRIFFRALSIDIVSVWQPVENMILVRWTVHGIPRVPWESRGRFDGISEYKLDKNGKIYEHRVHNIALSGPPKFLVVSVQELIQVFGSPSTPKPTCFEITSFPILSVLPIINMSGIKHRLLSMLPFDQCTEEEASKR